MGSCLQVNNHKALTARVSSKRKGIEDLETMSSMLDMFKGDPKVWWRRCLNIPVFLG